MGNTASKKNVKKEKSLSSVVDYIATNYILTQVLFTKHVGFFMFHMQAMTYIFALFICMFVYIYVPSAV